MYIGTITIEKGYTDIGGRGRQITRWNSAAVTISTGNIVAEDFLFIVLHIINIVGRANSKKSAIYGAVCITRSASGDNEAVASVGRGINIDRKPDANSEAQL